MRWQQAHPQRLKSRRVGAWRGRRETETGDGDGRGSGRALARCMGPLARVLYEQDPRYPRECLDLLTWRVHPGERADLHDDCPADRRPRDGWPPRAALHVVLAVVGAERAGAGPR
jgi:hypothetical protein